MKRTIHTSTQLDEYIEQMKQQGKSPSTVVNELFDEYVKMKNKQIIARSSNQ
nr:MAG TPA: antitoxin [Caudoviricetes sp.]